MTDNFQVVKLLPLHYMHVKDVNKNIVKVVTGPRTFYCEEFEEASEPMKMICIPPEHYVIVENPVVRDDKGDIVVNDNGEDKLRYGDEEVRFHQEPFPLYYGEVCGKVKPLPVVSENQALVLLAKRDFEHGVGKRDEAGKGKDKDKEEEDSRPRKAGAVWQVAGPIVYYPIVGVDIIRVASAIVLGPNQALHLKAIEDGKDWQGVERKAGEEWIVKTEGPYLPKVNEEVVAELSGIVLTHQRGMHVRAKHTFQDDKGKKKKAGEEWLVTRADTEVYFPGIHEEITQKDVQLKILKDNQYCIIADPYDEETGKLRLGATELRKGPLAFFLKPGETLIAEKQARVLRADQGLWVTSKEDESGTKRRPGDEWLVCGPGAFWEPQEIQVKRSVDAIISIWPLGIHIFRLWVIALLVLVFAVFFGWYLFW